jgi:hypothetical protein
MATTQIKVARPRAMLVMVNQYVDGSFIGTPFQDDVVHGGGHAERTGVRRIPGKRMSEYQTLKSDIKTGKAAG